MWLVVGLKSGFGWPSKETRVKFMGRDLILRPETASLDASIAVEHEKGEPVEEVLHTVRQFMSALAWVERNHVTETTTGGGSVPMGVSTKNMARHVNPHFRVDYLPEPNSEKQRLALALYREAVGVNSVPYAVLGFFKILNVVFGKGAEQERWINETLPAMENYSARERLEQLRASGEDVGRYLYESGRCAVAHAYSSPVVDPESPRDLRRLRADLPLIRALAEYAIEHDLGVKSRSTVWNEHLYELEGFRVLLGERVVADLKAGIVIASEEVPKLPPLSLRLRDRPRLPAFEGMQAEAVGVSDGVIAVRCVSRSGHLVAGVRLNIRDERLQFNPFDSSAVWDDGSSVAARARLDRVRFLREFIGNGELEIWDAQTAQVLSRCDPFIPVNVDIGATWDSLDELARAIEQEIAQREGSESGGIVGEQNHDTAGEGGRSEGGGEDRGTKFEDGT
jgi:hypothetical protein